VPVELHDGDPVDGFPATGSAYVVVHLGAVQFGVVHKLAEHVDGDSGVGVALGVAVPVGVDDDAPMAELGAVGARMSGMVLIHARW
jgi:hypothetical protein